MKILEILLCSIVIQYLALSQPTPEWISPSKYYGQSGWKILSASPPDVRFYYCDQNSFFLMDGHYGTNVVLTVPLTDNEKNPTLRVIDIGDVSGDGVGDIAFLSITPSPEYYSSVRLIDLNTGQVVFDLYDSTNAYSFGGVTDLDNDGKNELVLWDGGRFIVYETQGITTNVSNQSHMIPKTTHLKQNYPNPFNPETRIQYDLPNSGIVSLEIFDIDGRLVHSFPAQNQDSGTHEVLWDGKNNSGITISSGTYFYRLCVNGSSIAKKMIIIR